VKQVSGSIANGYYNIALLEIPTLAWHNSCLAQCQCRNFPQNYVVMPFLVAIANGITT